MRFSHSDVLQRIRYSLNASTINNSLSLIIVIATISVIVQVMDRSFGNTVILSLQDLFPRADVLLFGLLVMISIALNYVLIRFSSRSSRIERQRSKLGRILFVITVLLHYSSTAILVTILLQVVFTSEYNVYLMETVVGINLIMSSILLAILSSRLVRTYRNSPSGVVLAYTVAIAMLSLSGHYHLHICWQLPSGKTWLHNIRF